MLRFFLLMTLFYSCSNNIRNELTKFDFQTQNFEKNSLNINYQQTFEKFKTKFIEDTIFQKSRVHFPLLYIFSEDIDETNKDTTFIKEKDYIPLDLKRKTLKKEKMTLITINNEHSCKLVQKSLEIGFYIEYNFVLLNDKWFLKSMFDRST